MVKRKNKTRSNTEKAKMEEITYEKKERKLRQIQRTKIKTQRVGEKRKTEILGRNWRKYGTTQQGQTKNYFTEYCGR